VSFGYARKKPDQRFFQALNGPLPLLPTFGWDKKQLSENVSFHFRAVNSAFRQNVLPLFAGKLHFF
jgi:hypothetical protein